MKYCIAEGEVEFTAVRSQGPGGQNVNKVSSAVQLRDGIGVKPSKVAPTAPLLDAPSA